MKKILGIISNILSVLFVIPFSFYFSALGLMLIVVIDFVWSIPCMITIVSAFSFLCTLPLCILGIVLSIGLRKKEKQKESYLIQLLPFASVITGIFLFVVEMFWSNP